MDKLTLVLLAVLGFSSLCRSDDCSFPSFVLNAVWLTSDPDRTVSFSGPNITTVQAPWGIANASTTEVHTCTKVINETENIYEVKTDSGSQCLKITLLTPTTKLTDKVIRLATTSISDSTCNETEWTNWQMVLVTGSFSQSASSVPECTLKGGFLFTSATVVVPEEPKPVCPTAPLPGRLESDCLPGEGLQLTFPYPACVPITGWSPKQTLYCNSSWTEGKYDFTLLGTDYNETPRWCMRRPKDSSYLEIFLGKTCPQTETLENGTQVTTLTLTALDSSTCADDFDKCTTQYCNDNYKSLCRKTCKLCDPDTPPTNCNFSGDVLTPGTWQNGADKAEVKISLSQIADTSYTTLTCREAVDQNSYVLSAAAQKGCQPRFTCGKFSRLSPPVLRYKYGKTLTETTNKVADCQESYFEDDPSPIGDKYHSRFYKNLIATSVSLLNQTEPCALKGNFSISGSIKNEACSGSISDLDGCTVTSDMSVASNCSFKGEMSCIGNIPSDVSGTEMTIVKDENNITCWVFSSEDTGDTKTVFLLSSAQCNEDTPTQLKLKKVSVDGNLTATKVDSCGTTPTPSTTTSKPTTSTNKTTEPTSEPTTEPTSEPTTREASTTNTAAPTPAPHQGPGAGAVVGIVFLCLLLSAAFVGLAYYLWKKYGHRRVPYNSLT